jgi:hypothetical protein
MTEARTIVQFSTGIGSAEVLRRAVEGPGEVIALTADTLVECPDNWRFAREVITWLGCRWVVLAEGHTPMGIGQKHRVVPNDRMAICSRILKRELLRNWIDANCDPATDVIALGFDWTEPHRIERARPLWQPFEVIAPLMDPPLMQKAELLTTWRGEYGIAPPALYAEGFAHANCGGACVRGGQAQWELLLRKRPDTYAKWEADEQVIRTMLGKDVSILRNRRQGTSTPLSLRSFREQLERQPSLFDKDWGACACMDAPDALDD